MIKLKEIDYRHYICIALTLGIITGGVFAFPNAFGRLAESIRDFGLSIGYSFCEMFGIQHSIAVTVNDLPKMPFFPLPPALGEHNVVVSLPDTWNGFVNNWHAYWQLWIDKNNFLGYISSVRDTCKIITYDKVAVERQKFKDYRKRIKAKQCIAQPYYPVCFMFYNKTIQRFKPIFDRMICVCGQPFEHKQRLAILIVIVVAFL